MVASNPPAPATFQVVTNKCETVTIAKSQDAQKLIWIQKRMRPRVVPPPPGLDSTVWPGLLLLLINLIFQ